MKRLFLMVFSAIVSWLAVSVVVGVLFAIIGNPLYRVSPSYPSTGSGLTGLLILGLTIAVAVSLYRTFRKRWLTNIPPSS